MGIKLVKALDEDRDFILNYFSNFNDNIYIVLNEDSNRCGVIEYVHLKEQDLIKIEYIHIFLDYQGNGYATDVIDFFKNNHSNCAIYGDVKPSESAYYFWESVGAEFDMYDDLDYYIKNRECIPFILN